MVKNFFLIYNNKIKSIVMGLVSFLFVPYGIFFFWKASIRMMIIVILKMVWRNILTLCILPRQFLAQDFIIAKSLVFLHCPALPTIGSLPSSCVTVHNGFPLVSLLLLFQMFFLKSLSFLPTLETLFPGIPRVWDDSMFLPYWNFLAVPHMLPGWHT